MDGYLKREGLGVRSTKGIRIGPASHCRPSCMQQTTSEELHFPTDVGTANSGTQDANRIVSRVAGVQRQDLPLTTRRRLNGACSPINHRQGFVKDLHKCSYVIASYEAQRISSMRAVLQCAPDPLENLLILSVGVGVRALSAARTKLVRFMPIQSKDGSEMKRAIHVLTSTR